jgi:hypothetical protein
VARTLDAREIIATAERLERRVSERFPRANLARLAGELTQVTRKAEARTEWIRRPIVALRVAVGAVIAAGLALIAIALQGVSIRVGGIFLGELAQGIEAMLSTTAFLGAAAFFLVTIETRVKRRRALRAIRELRVMAHVVDMHQLTKDPKSPHMVGRDTASSPTPMSPYELYRYLDYCSEMLALLSKVAQLYVDDLDDRTVIDYVDGLERLVYGLSDKLWRKMTMVDASVARQAADAPPPQAPAGMLA